jgi:hypothetical protein
VGFQMPEDALVTNAKGWVVSDAWVAAWFSR